MPNNNKQRKGKWQPFDALEGFQSSLRKIEYEKNKISKPVLSEDALEELNEMLNQALESRQEAVVEYYQNGYCYEFQGIIEEVNLVYGKLKISGKTLKINSILKISFVN